MRVLNTSTLSFEEFPDSETDLDRNSYAILSHRWGANDDEISFEDICSLADISRKRASIKLRGFCELARAMGFRYGWIDTCCINKANSSELSEAINSMYRWYRESKICIAYLEDVPQRPMAESEWFNRGWTLQELIAPAEVAFFDRDWRPIGKKTDPELLSALSKRTRIPQDVLKHTVRPSVYSVAQRMSWAAERKTTRVEDRAYSLMGLFDIYMPMIYGERETAFLRLQQQIVQKVKDESIFAWDLELSDIDKPYYGIYAPSPAAYARCSTFEVVKGSHGFSELHGQLSLSTQILPFAMETFYATLHCTDNQHTVGNRIAILLARTSVEGEFVRVQGRRKHSWYILEPTFLRACRAREVRVPVEPAEPPLDVFHGFELRGLLSSNNISGIPKVLSNCLSPAQDRLVQFETLDGITGIVQLSHPKTSKRWRIRWVTLSFDANFNPLVLLAAPDSQWARRLEGGFERALSSGPASQEHKQLMQDGVKAFKASQNMYIHSGPSWETKRILISVDRDKGLDSAVIGFLNLQISVTLQSDHSSSLNCDTSDRKGTVKKGSSMIWVVEIKQAGKMTLWKRIRRQWDWHFVPENQCFQS